MRLNPWEAKRDQIVDWLVIQGTVERRREQQSFLFFKWMRTVHRLSAGIRSTLDDYNNERGSPRNSDDGDDISKGISQGFDDRTISSSG